MPELRQRHGNIGLGTANVDVEMTGLHEALAPGRREAEQQFPEAYNAVAHGDASFAYRASQPPSTGSVIP